jgi:NADP-dependent 3-hydroxy acid dehydrogenase YdfG
VITGGASGIGRALAERAVSDGLRAVLIDVDADAVTAAAEELDADPFVVDVADGEAMMEAANRVASDVGDVHLLFNNAGVFLGGPFVEMTDAQRRFIVDVNLWGVVNGMQAFLPGMIERDTGHVVNTSSVSGLVTARNAAIYNASKHAVIGLSETVFRELDAVGSNVGMSVLCPGAVATDIVNSAKHWPDRLGPAPAPVEDVSYPQLDELMTPAQVAAITFEGIAERRFWILTHRAQFAPAMCARMEGAVAGENPDESTVDPNWKKGTGRVPG